MASLIFVSCAHKVDKTPDPDEITIDSVLSLSRSSYIKGCIDGMNDIKKEKTHGSRLNRCKNFSNAHIKKLEELLK